MTEPSFLTETRAGYDAIAADYAEHFRDARADLPLDRAILTAFAELVGAVPDAKRVLEVGCGPGEITAFLHAEGLDVSGLDLSPGMLAVARRDYPELRFVEGSMLALDEPDGALAGVVAFYSIIHLPPEEVPNALAEFRRVLVPGGLLMLAFQVGEDVSHHDEGFGHAISLDFRRLLPEDVTERLDAAGFDPVAQLVREANDREMTPRAFLIARRRG